MYKSENLLEELEILDDLRRKAEEAYFNDDDLEIEEVFRKAASAERTVSIREGTNQNIPSRIFTVPPRIHQGKIAYFDHLCEQ